MGEKIVAGAVEGMRGGEQGGYGPVDCGKRNILGNDSEDRDTIIVQLEPTGPGGFHDETRWMDPSSRSLMRRVVLCVDDMGAEPAKS